MLNALSTAFLHDEKSLNGDHGQMTSRPLASFASRLEYVLNTCEYPDWAALARDLGVSPQAVDNWRRREAIGPKNRTLLRDRTRVSIEWLESGTGEPFPNGPKRYVGHTSPAASSAIRRNTDAIDQLRGTVLAMIDVITETEQGSAAALVELLERTVTGDSAKLSFHARLLKTLRARSLEPRRLRRS